MRFPRRFGYLAVPAVALVLAGYHAGVTGGSGPDLATLRAAEEGRSALEEIARALDEADADSDEVRRLAEEIRRSMERLGSEEDPEKAALREISALEALIAELQASLSDDLEDLGALAGAFEGKPGETAEALKSGDASKAADALERESKEVRDPEELAELARQIREALDRMQQQGLSREASQLSEAAGSGDAQQMAEALRRMAEALRNQQGGRAASRMLSKAQQRLQEMKFGQGRSEESRGDGSPDPGEGELRVESFGKGERPGDESLGASSIPSGQPGGELDTGTTESPFGARSTRHDPEGEQTQIAGRLGEGESLQNLVAAGPDTPKAARRYRELYEAAAADAESAVLQENIPLGSRFYIKRYFESIRPKESR